MLLKNDNQTLPLKASVRKIAVIGPSADDPEALLGNYNGFSSKHVTPLEGIETRFAGKAEVRFALGSRSPTMRLSVRRRCWSLVRRRRGGDGDRRDARRSEQSRGAAAGDLL